AAGRARAKTRGAARSGPESISHRRSHDMTDGRLWQRLAVVAWLILAPRPAAAGGGFGTAPPPSPPPGSSGLAAASSGAVAPAETSSSYYEHALADRGMSASAALESDAAGGLPSALYVVEAAGGVEYRSADHGAWQVKVEVGERPHERVDAVYDLVLALPLPVGFPPRQGGIAVREGREGSSVPKVYAGDKVSLKRNAPLESSWLPRLVGAPDGLPDLAGTGYDWTLWDTIVRYDAEGGTTLQGFGTLGYTADATAVAPDPRDPRNAA